MATSDLKLPPMTVEHMARTLATARERARTQERERCVQLIEDMRDTERGKGNEALAQYLDVVAEAVRGAPAEVERTEPVVVSSENDPLPPVQFTDDFKDRYADPDGIRFIYHVGGFECVVRCSAVPGEPDQTERHARAVADALNRLYAHERGRPEA
jgi:hypothetical protein